MTGMTRNSMSNLLRISILALLFTPQMNLYAQPDTMWTNTFGGSNNDSGYSMQQTSDGGYIITGTTRSFGAGDVDVWLVKTDASGDMQWDRTFGGSSGDYGYSVRQTTDGGYIITGFTLSYGAGGRDVWLIKTDASGNLQWDKPLGGYDLDEGRSVQQTSDGGYVIIGFTDSYGAGDEDVWLIKTDASGDYEWTRLYGGHGSDIGISVQQTSDYGYVVAGYTDSYGAGDEDVWLIKTDAWGSMQWDMTYGGSSGDFSRSVQQTSDGGYLITGRTYSYSPGGSDLWLIKTDASGEMQWDRTFFGPNSEEGYAVLETIDGGFIIVGYTTSLGAGGRDVWLIKTDASGDMQWDMTYGGSSWDEGRSVQQTSDGGYVIAGYTRSYGAGSADVWLIKTTPELGIEADVLDSSLTVECFPNPSPGSVTIAYGMQTGGYAALSVYDLVGRRVATLVEGYCAAGQHTLLWNPEDVSSGIYLLQLETTDSQSTTGLLLCR